MLFDDKTELSIYFVVLLLDFSWEKYLPALLTPLRLGKIDLFVLGA
ncbi:hypothetical protein X474_02905 [Dethiosulfatarculus sandiegensis]|uniref:Uncharacterized protein n=1 Tax=Dethiosulfatarculus sandiegensis TaxID=1429043 RepID=A0A0D2GM05_9BACT|nr:hypothetical protein X474_02905 [Dethiosulfatarculus sandiegensis]